MTDEQRKRIHAITYSTDDRAELAERIVALEDENAKLREELEAVGTAAYLYGRNDLAAENAKLRELVRDLERARSALCDEYPNRIDVACDECSAYDVCNANPVGRMRELGVEVDDDD